MEGSACESCSSGASNGALWLNAVSCGVPERVRGSFEGTETRIRMRRADGCGRKGSARWQRPERRRERGRDRGRERRRGGGRDGGTEGGREERREGGRLEGGRERRGVREGGTQMLVQSFH